MGKNIQNDRAAGLPYLKPGSLRNRMKNKVSRRTGYGGLLRCRTLLAFCLLAFLTLPGRVDCKAEKPPFMPGEKLVFEVKWLLIPAGEAVLRVLPVEKRGTVDCYHFVLNARTYSYIDPIFKVDDLIEGYADTGMQRSYFYSKQNRGTRKRQITVTFDWSAGEARYSSSGGKRKPISIPPGSFDPLSVFYSFRFYELRENLVIKAAVTDGKKSVIGHARVIRRETIQVAAGTYDTYLVEPDLEHIGGVFEKSPGAKLKIWVTADHRRMPVRVESKVIVGSFVAELISAE
jgi:hypothetical protein